MNALRMCLVCGAAAVCSVPQTALAQASLPVDPGEVVAACFSGNMCLQGGPSDPIDTDPVLVLFDLRNPAVQGAVLDMNWLAPSFHNEPPGNPQYWSARNLGQLFGVCLDDEPNPNIYATATRAYGDWPDNTIGMWGPGGPGGVYKVDGSTGAICVLASLPQPPLVPGSAEGTGLGSLCFARAQDGKTYLFVTNPDDGLIYRVPTIPCPLPPMFIFQTYDHGVTGRTAEGMTALPDDPSQRFTPDARRQLWGIAYHPDENRLYYATMSKEVWSVALDFGGSIVGATARHEFTQAGGGNIAGLTISPNGNLYTAGRTGGFVGNLHLCSNGPAHQSSLREYQGGHLAWVPEPATKYEVGRTFSFQNCAGGAAVDCDENVWVMGDALHFGPDLIYGLQWIPAGGNPGQNTTVSYLVDLDGNTATLAKTALGQVAIRNECSQCVNVIDKSILCEVVESPDGQGGTVTGKYTYKFCFVNKTSPPTPIQYIGFTTPGVSPQTISFANPVLPGQMSPTITLTLMPPAGAQEFCFNAIFMSTRIEVCCQIEHCVELPECDCVQWPVCEATCIPGTNDWSLTFTAQNLSMGPVNQLFLFPEPPGTATFTVNPSYFSFPNVPIGGTAGPFTVTLSGVSAGQTVCIRVSIHLDGMECCSEVKCFRIPDIACMPPPPPPTILAHPSPADVCYGEDAVFTASASVGAECGPMLCQWRRNGEFIFDGPTGHGSVVSGAGTEILTILGATPADEGLYDNMVGNCAGATTDAAPLSVTVLTGDADRSNFVGFSDVTAVLTHFGLSGGAAGHADVNGDGVVNFADVTTVLTFFGLHCP